MWIHIYTIWKMNINSKKGRKTSFSYETKVSKSFITTRKNEFILPNQEKKGNYFVNSCLSHGKKNFNSENSRKRNCSYETKTLISFIPTRRMWLWCPILKRKEIMWIHLFPNGKMNFNSKNGRETSFSYETKASKSFIRIRRMCL